MIKNNLDGVEIIYLGLYIKEGSILILSDFHIGYEEALNKSGILVPRFQFKNILENIGYLFDRLNKENKKVNQVVVNGDIKHEFGTISKQEWKETLSVLDFLIEKVGKVVLIKGNHDTIIGPIANKKGVTVVDNLVTDSGYLIMHGHYAPSNNLILRCHTIVIGHEHPAIGLRNSFRVERFKCFLFGSYHKRRLIVLPSFCPISKGTDVLTEELHSPLLSNSVDDFDVYVIPDIYEDNNISYYYFGKVRDILTLN